MRGGTIPDGWHRRAVADLIAQGILFVGDGYRAKNEELGPAGLPFARAGNINDEFRFTEADCFPEENLSRVGNKVSQPGDVVFTSKGTVGRFAFVRHTTPRFVYSPQLCFWRVLNREEIDARFLYFWMFSRDFFLQYSGVKGQTDMADYVSLTDQRRMHITLPPLPEQRAIAHILGTLDDKIDLNRQMNTTLEAMARALFKSWFVDFDPVRAKMEGRRPARMDEETAALFPNGFEESELGKIPREWTVDVIGNVVELAYGRALKERNRQAGSIPVYGSNGQVGWHNEALVDIPGIIVGRKGNPGTVTWSSTAFFPIDTTFYVVPRGRWRSMFYLFYTLQMQHLPSLAADSAVPGLNRNLAYMNRMLVPPAHLLDAFERQVAPFYSLIQINNVQSRILAALRDTLLPKLLSGEVRVECVEEELLGNTGGTVG